MSEKTKIEYNWYEILDLEYYPHPEEDEAKIKAKIEEKRKEWLRKETDPLNGAKFKNYGEFLKRGTIQEEMLDSAKRRELIKDAQKKLFEPIDKFLKYFENTVITENAIKEIAKKTKRKESLIEERIRENGKIEQYDEREYKNFCENLNKKFEFLIVERNLKIIDKKDLYDFLNSESFEINKLTEKEIIEQINEKRKTLIKSDNETSAKKKLYTECEKILGNSEKRKEYDEYLKHLKYVEVKNELDEIKDVYGITNKAISKSQSSSIINDLIKIIKNEQKAKNIFIGFCEEAGIPYEILNISNKTEEIYEISEANKSTNKSKELSDMACNNAFSAIREFELEEAKQYLFEAKTYWSENPRIEIIETKLKEIIEEISEIRNHVNFKNYGIAREKYELFKKKYPNFSDVNIERELYNTPENNRNDYNNSNYNSYNNFNNHGKKKSSAVILIPFIVIIAILIIGTGIFFIVNQVREYQRQNSFPSVSTVNTLPNDPNSQNTQTNNTNSTSSNRIVRKPPVDNRHEIVNGYTYLKPNGHSSTYSFKVTQWAELVLNPSVSLSDNANVQASYEDYCRIVREIEKVDNGIVPGTNRVFENATYQEVVDAYKDHLREISQIRQIYDLINGNDNDFEPAAGCFYKGTKWNTNNMQFKAKEFKSQAIDELWSRFSY